MTTVDLPSPEPFVDWERPRILALTGGGIRGLFGARALELIEAEGNLAIADCFDVFAGTSIGGLIAIALAVEVPPADIAAAIRCHGPRIFRKKWHHRMTNPWRLLRTQYEQEPLKSAIEAVLGDKTHTPLGEVPSPLLVTAVDCVKSTPKVFTSPHLADSADDSQTSVLDVALATSAAPTYLPPHRIGDSVYVDGGLVANSPDLLVARKCIDRLGSDWDRIRILSVGTAAYESPKEDIVRLPGGARWLASHDLFGVTIDAQARLSIAMAEAHLGDRFYRLDEPTEKRIVLDDASAPALEQLDAASERAVARLRATTVVWNTFFAGRRRTDATAG